MASEKKTIALCHVSAQQNNRLLFTATLTFAREPAPGGKTLEHAMTRPNFPADIAAISHDDDEGTSRGLFEWIPASEPIGKDIYAHNHYSYRRLGAGNHSPLLKRFRRLVRVKKRVT